MKLGDRNFKKSGIDHLLAAEETLLGVDQSQLQSNLPDVADLIVDFRTRQAATQADKPPGPLQLEQARRQAIKLEQDRRQALRDLEQARLEVRLRRRLFKLAIMGPALGSAMLITAVGVWGYWGCYSHHNRALAVTIVTAITVASAVIWTLALADATWPKLRAATQELWRAQYAWEDLV